MLCHDMDVIHPELYDRHCCHPRGANSDTQWYWPPAVGAILDISARERTTKNWPKEVQIRDQKSPARPPSRTTRQKVSQCLRRKYGLAHRYTNSSNQVCLPSKRSPKSQEHTTQNQWSKGIGTCAEALVVCPFSVDTLSNSIASSQQG